MILEVSFSSNKQDEPKFNYRISQGLVLGLALLVGFIIVTSFSIIWFEGKPILNEMSLDAQTKLGQNISIAMERELEEVKGISSTIAAAAMGLPADDRLALIPKIVPQMLQNKDEITILAGGGVWPEPDVFEKGVGRNSFFWALNENEIFEQIDDYNSQSGPGYHREEWYVPARVLSTSSVYWSKSYTDPYSLQPMVTCTTPMRDMAGEFKGVSTIDLKLDGVSGLLRQFIAGFDAYAFIVDRNNRFIVFPTLGIDLSSARAYRGNSGFEYLHDLVKVYPAFELISERLEGLDKRLYSELANEKPDYKTLVNRLVEGSYQISLDEARRLVAYQWHGENTQGHFPTPLDIFDIPNDILLRGGATAFVYQMPTTDWRIITVFERKAYGAISDVVSQKLVGAILVSSLVFGVCAFVLLKIFVINRIFNMVSMLRSVVKNKDEKSIGLEYKNNDELGLLAYWFNYRTKQLEEAFHKVKKINKRKSEFLGGISQELRKPVMDIIGFNRRLIIKAGGDLDEENYQTLLDIQKSSNRMLTLIDDVFEVSQLEAGAVSLKFQWESVNLLLDDACSQVTGQVADADLDFRVQSLVNDIRICVDRQKVIQALLHLLANALEATEKGEIVIEAGHEQMGDEDAISFAVKDTGAGIPDETKYRMYKQLIQIEEYSGQDRGIGLGLYLVREIITLHRGAMFLESVVGKGSTFKIVLPVKSRDHK